MKMTVTLKLTDGTSSKVTALPVDFVGWERQMKRKVSDIQSGIGLEDMLFLAYAALKRGGSKLPEFDSWMESVEEIATEADDPKATRSAASKGH